MECLIHNAIEPHMERIYRILNNLDKKLDFINKRLEKIEQVESIVKIEKLINDILELDLKIDKLVNPTHYESKMEDID
jgi:hypothetical protein